MPTVGRATPSCVKGKLLGVLECVGTVLAQQGCVLFKEGEVMVSLNRSDLGHVGESTR